MLFIQQVLETNEMCDKVCKVVFLSKVYDIEIASVM